MRKKFPLVLPERRALHRNRRSAGYTSSGLVFGSSKWLAGFAVLVQMFAALLLLTDGKLKMVSTFADC